VKSPAFRRGLPPIQLHPELAIGFLLLAGLRLPALLLLSGLRLPTTLLTRLLVGVLGLLARILIRIAHSGSPLLNAAWVNLVECNWLPRELVVPSGNTAWRAPVTSKPAAKTNL
jgi:hypothetical protein